MWIRVVWLTAALGAPAAEISYRITTIAGGTWCGDGRPAATAQLGSPEGVAADAAGNVYVADALDHRVRKISPAGIITTLAGDGYPGFRGDGGPASDAELNSPYGVLADAAGNVYVADLGNGRVRRISPDGVIRTVAGGGSSVAGPEGTEARAARLNQPRNLAFDNEGNLYVSDFGDHRLYRVTPGGLIFRVAGVGAPGSIPDGEWTEAITAPLNAPAGLAVDRAGALYVADSGNRRVRRIERGRIISVPAPPDTLTTPTGLALDPGGQLYVADKAGARVVQLVPGPPRVIAGAGAAPITGELFQPRDLAWDRLGFLYVAETRSAGGIVRRIGPSGWIGAFAGDGTFRPPGDDGPALFAHFADPTGIAVDAAANVYVADRLAHRVRRTFVGGIATLAGNGAPGWAGDGGPSLAAQLNGPAGLALDGAGNLWVTESIGSSLREVTNGRLMKRAAGGLREGSGYSGDGGPAILARLNGPEGAAADAAGNVYVADTYNHVIREVSAGGVITTVAGKGVPGYAGDGGPAVAALLNSPTGVAPAPDGGLYIADNGNHVIRRVTSGGLIATIAGTGAPGFGGDGGPAAKAQFWRPAHVVVDAGGNLFVADSENHRIRRFAPGGLVATVAGTGVPGFSGDDGPALEAQLRRPWAIALDGAGNLYVADRGNLRIRKLSPAAAAPPVAPPPALELVTIVNAASLQPGAVAPGEIVSLFGTNLGPGVGAGGLAPELAGTQVLFNGRPAALLYVQYGQINLQVPYGVGGQTSAEIELRRDGASKGRFIVPVAPAAPGIFTRAGGTGLAAAYNEDRSANAMSNAAARGTILTLYATGEGQTIPAGVDGLPAVAPYPQPALDVSLTIGGQPATLLYAGAAPGFAGLMQINARVPDSVAAGSAAVELTVGSARSQAAVFVTVK